MTGKTTNREMSVQTVKVHVSDCALNVADRSAIRAERPFRTRRGIV
jgi:hypothetical protein